MKCANAAPRRSFVVTAVMLLSAATGIAQDRGGGRGVGRAGGPGPLNAYVYAGCSAASTATIHLVVVTGPVPAAVPASVPQPSVHLVLNTPIDTLSTGQSIAVSPAAAKGGPDALALSCPVVGDCVPAQSGTITIEPRGANGDLIGTYQATWPGAPARTGRFTAAWREPGKPCG